MLSINGSLIRSYNQSNRLRNFDFAVIRYLWSSNAGKDLDTRTAITNPSRNIEVGWNRQQNDSEYLIWGGDNTGSGVESVLLNLQKLKSDNIGQQSFQVLCSAFWYSFKSSGDIEIQFETYLGGVMQQSGFDFINNGGSIVDNIRIPVNVVKTNTGSPHNGQPLLTLTYNATTNSSELSTV